MTNEYIYSDEHVSISASAAILEGTRYSIPAISELFILDRRPLSPCRGKSESPMLPALYCTAVFSAAGLLAIYPCQMSEHANNGEEILGLFTGGLSSIVLTLIVIWLADRIAGPRLDYPEHNPPDYTLIIATQGGHRSAISSPDRWYIERIEGCIEYAISLSARAQKRSANLVSIE